MTIHLKSIFLLSLALLIHAAAFSQQAKDVSYNELKNIIHQKNDTVYIVNFFASWCDPCLAELPEFVKFSDEHKNIKMIFVSLDFKKDHQQTLKKLIEKYHIKQPVYFLNESKAGSWISDVDSTWSGAIPATIFVNNKKSKFYSQTFTIETINQTLNTFTK